MKKLLIAGAGGYIGSQMVEFFLKKGFIVIALDRFFFGETLQEYSSNKKLQIVKDDIRYVDKNLLKNVDIIINLASISNDPSSELDPAITKAINYKGAVRLAKFAKEMGVKKYLLASSCSVYGAGENELTENSPLAPISEYAKSKINAEKDILKLADKKFCVTILRLATVYGLSLNRMRFDLIINVMTLHAWKNNKIFIMGGGEQWRPLIHINDVIHAFDLLLQEKAVRKINKEIFNVGSNKQNYQVFQIANMFKKHFPFLVIESVPGDPDKRSYFVNFDKIKNVLGYQTMKTVDDGILEIKEALEKENINYTSTVGYTLSHYQYLIEAERILSQVMRKGKVF